MWWGGSGDQEGSPPPDPSAEEGDFSQDNPAHIKQELGDLQEQFNQQQALIGQLKDMLKKKDSALSTREKEVESYAARLAKMKPRLGRAGAKMMPVLPERVEILGSSQDSPPASEPPGVTGAFAAAKQGAVEGRLVEEKKLPSSESGSRAKILLLRKQLEENRLKFERQQKENAEKRATMEEMKSRISRLRTEVEQRDSLIQSLQEGRGAMSDESMTQKLYQQIVYKDNSVLELTQKLGQLEELIQEQRETLSEKDRVIEARTEAVSLVAKAQDEKSLKTLEELEEVRHQMKKMQEDFIIKEQEYSNEKDSLSKELKEKVKKVAQLEENGRRLENLRFELSTRNAELQEKIVTLQADAKILRNQSEYDRKITEEKDSLLQELKQKLVRAEAHGQKKLKALEKQLRSIKQDGNAGEQILELQNSIAELEEEKGNLQLKLVDFDDLKAANEKLTVLRNKLEDQVKNLNSDLDSQLSAITQLEAEKIKLVEGTNERENRIFDLESELNVTKTSLEEVTQAKVTLELRLCEVEEQRDTSEKGRIELENQLTESGIASIKQLIAEKGSLEESLQSILKERNEWETKCTGQISTVQESEEEIKAAVQEKEAKVKECKRLMNILTDKENTIATLSIKIDKRDATLAETEDQLKLMSEDIEKKKFELEEMNHRFKQEVEKVCEASKTIEDLEAKNSRISSEIQSRETKLGVMNETLENLNRTLNEKNITIQNLVGEVSGLQDQVKQKDKSVNDHINRLEQLESQINIRDQRIEELHTTVIQKEEQLSKTEIEIGELNNKHTNIAQQFEASKISLNSELDIMSTMLNNLKNQVAAANMDIEIKVKEIQNNQVIISKYEQEICDKNIAFDELQVSATNLKAKVSSLGSSLSQKEASILQLQTELEEKISCVENLKAKYSASEQKLHQLLEENLSLASEKSSLEEELCDIKSIMNQKEESIQHLNSEMTSKTYQQNQDIEMLKQALVEEQQQKSKLEMTVGNLTSEKEHKVSEIEKWQTETLEKRERLSEVSQALECSQLQVQEKDALISDLQIQIAQNQEQLASAQEQVSHTHNQLLEVKEQFSQNEDQLAQAHCHLTDTQMQLAQAREQVDKTQEELVVAQSDLKETQTQYQKFIALASEFEEQLHLKTTDLEMMEKGKESSIKELQDLKAEISRLEIELKANKDYAENLEVGSSKLQEWATLLQNELESAKFNQNCTQKELSDVVEELVSRNNELKQLQHIVEQEQEKAVSLQQELTQTQSLQQQHEQRADSLQAELTQALSLQQQSESEVAALSLTQQKQISHLEADLLTLTQMRDQLQSDFEKSSLQLQNHVETISHLSATVESLMSEITSKDDEIEFLKKGILEYENAKHEVENSLKEITEAKIQLENKLQVSHSEVPSLSGESLEANPEFTRLSAELAAAQEQKYFIEEECNGLRADASILKQQLQEARQTITQLQTSLATQSQSTTTAAPGWEDWGEVDLGTPEPKEMPELENPLVISLQKSLTDKDEMLVMIQDQLKEALQQINTISEEKKVMEQQKKSAESSSAQQKQQWEQDQKELLALRNKLEEFDLIQSNLENERQKLSSLEKEIIKKQHDNELLQQQVIHITCQQEAAVPEQLQHSEALSNWPVQEHKYGTWPSEQVTDTWSSIEKSAGDWPLTDQDGKATKPPDQSVDATQMVDQLTGDTPSEYQVTEAAAVVEEIIGSEANTNTTTVHWKQPESEDPFSFLHSTQANEKQDPASWFDELHPQEPVSQQPVQQMGDVVGEHQTELQQQEQNQSVEPVNIEELQFKLSWYEEQWSTWTGHYTQLQASYQEAQQQVALLTQQLQEFHHGISQGIEVKADEAASSCFENISDENKVQQQMQEISELKNKLSMIETAHEQLKEEHINLQQEVSHTSVLEDQLEKLTASTSNTDRLEEAEAEVDHLRGFETQVYELQSQVQALQHQCTAMQSKLAEAETERTRLLEVEVLYGELQSCIQESETKREGSKSRVQELELMVQSAESEIARLRNEIEVLNQAGQAVETDRERLQTDAQGLGAEMTKLNNEVLRLQGEVELHKTETARLQNEIELYRSENVRLQNEGESYKDEFLKLQAENEGYKEETLKCQTVIDSYKTEVVRLEGEHHDLDDEITRVRSELQRAECENNQLRSELEVMEGEHGRLRSDYEILEGENSRARGEYEALSQTSQMTEAEKESLESEVQRITAQNMTMTSEIEHLQGEIQRLTEVRTSAESEITRLRVEIEGFKLLDIQYNELEVKYNELQTQFATVEPEPRSKNTSESEAHALIVEEVDWSAEGRIEDEHLKRSSSVDLKYQEEIDNLKSKVIALEKEKNSFYDELQAAKMKSGKMLQKLKLTQSKNEALSKEVQKLKAKAGGFSDLDQALEEEWKAQVARAETERDELKQKLDETENEKEHLANQVDVLTTAQEQYLELKEDQDTTVKLLKARNKELEGQQQALEWRISELEEIVEQPVQEMNSQNAVDLGTPQASDNVETLKVQISSLHQEIDVLKSEKERLKTYSKELEEKVESLSNDNASFQSMIGKLKEAKSKAENDTNNYKSLYIELDSEHSSLKKEKEKVNEELKELVYTHDTLKAAYNSMFIEYNDLRDVCDSHKYDIGILKGERDRLVEEVDSLKKQLQAFHEEEEEETIRALQDECFSLREQNNLLHEENTALEVQAEDAKEKVNRVNSALEQNIEMQNLLRDELMKKSEEISFHTTTNEGQERQLTYMKAEIAALKTKLAQQDQAEESSIETSEELKLQVEQLQECNQQLQFQVETAEASLAKLTKANEDDDGNVFTSPTSTGTELEAALASLHLRDLRCQQLSLEITKLLEERDALQLKLSAALRQTQELSRELSLSHQLPAPVSPEPSLDQKLAELRELNDSLEQKALLSLQGTSSTSMGRRITISGLPSSPMFTPHTAPPTPTATRHADYTLTREAQGTSSTLIDWILGKSTPRVLHV